MDETSSPPPLPESAAPPRTSLVARLMNVFAAPGEVFEEVATSPPNPANWLVPILLGCIAAVIFTVVAFSQDAVVRQIREAREQAIQQQVDAGKIPKDAGEKAKEMTERFMSPTMLIVFGSLGAIATNFAWLFLVALILWLIGKFGFKAAFPYMQCVEITGLSGMINVLGAMVGMFLVVITGNIRASLGPVLLVASFDQANKTHAALASVNVILIWYVAVLALGFARLSRASYGKAAAWVFGVWMLLTLGLLLLTPGKWGPM